MQCGNWRNFLPLRFYVKSSLAEVENVVTRERILRRHDENFSITADSTGKSPFLFLFLHCVKMMEFCSHDFLTICKV